MIEVLYMGCNTTKNPKDIFPGFSFTTFFILEIFIFVVLFTQLHYLRI